MKGNLKNEKDVKDVSTVSERTSKAYIKIKKGKNFIRLMDKTFVTEFVHGLKTEKMFYEIVCLGGVKAAGYAPDICPICKQAKKHWDKIKELKSDSNFNKSKKLQAEAEYEKKKGKELQTRQTIKMVAVYGEAVKEKAKGKIFLTPEFENEAKIINISTAQWRKLTQEIFDKYLFMKTNDDLVNRNLVFKKEAPDGKTEQNTPIEIIPCKEKSNPPKIEGDLPDLEECFVYREEQEVKNILKDFLSDSDDDLDESDIDTSEEDLEDEEDEDEENESGGDVKEDAEDSVDDDEEIEFDPEEERKKRKAKEVKKNKKSRK